MLAKYVPGDIKYIFTKFYRHISTNNEANRKFVISISNFLIRSNTSYALSKLSIIFFSKLAVKQNEHNWKRDPTYSEYR
jgi:hypothetical protein